MLKNFLHGIAVAGQGINLFGSHKWQMGIAVAISALQWILSTANVGNPVP
jgi:hypothetical protein